MTFMIADTTLTILYTCPLPRASFCSSLHCNSTNAHTHQHRCSLFLKRFDSDISHVDSIRMSLISPGTLSC